MCVSSESPEYTGAPFYAAQSSLKVGGDLAFVFCAKQAELSIKSYSAELMTIGIYDADMKLALDIRSDETIRNETVIPFGWEYSYHPYIMECVTKITNMFSRLHVLVVGPGLGRGFISTLVAYHVIIKARAHGVPLVIDADALWVVSNNLHIIHGNHVATLTPNLGEFDRLVKSAVEAIQTSDGKGCDMNSDTYTKINSRDDLMSILNDLQSGDVDVRIHALSKYLGNVCIVVKGRHDIVCDGRTDIVHEIVAEGSSRRCGGQVTSRVSAGDNCQPLNRL